MEWERSRVVSGEVATISKISLALPMHQGDGLETVSKPGTGKHQEKHKASSSSKGKVRAKHIHIKLPFSFSTAEDVEIKELEVALATSHFPSISDKAGPSQLLSPIDLSEGASAGPSNTDAQGESAADNIKMEEPADMKESVATEEAETGLLSKEAEGGNEDAERDLDEMLREVTSNS